MPVTELASINCDKGKIFSSEELQKMEPGYNSNFCSAGTQTRRLPDGANPPGVECRGLCVYCKKSTFSIGG